MSRPSSKKRKRKSNRKGESASKTKNVVGLSSLHVDNENKRIVVFTDDMLLNQLRRDGPKIEKSFDSLCQGELVQLSSLVSRTAGLLYSGLAIAQQNNDEIREACAMLLINASNSFGSAVAVLRMGYVLQPGIILRSLLEALSTSLHLLQKPEDLAPYEEHNLSSTKTIAAAKRALPPFGQLYGHFSDNFVHIGRFHKKINPVREYSKGNEALELNLSSLRIAAWLLYVTTELAFNELVKEPSYWQPVDQGYMYNPSEAEKEWMTEFFGLDLA
ncbi:hypothetical protein [Chromohalobacter sp. 296-RDG]|uniref:hypothetical protein n=1 Tax=Chromohalobacter sp. 296-RDG TaxID=2994062 RepID=UPI002468A93B|nr:hypothetical protein [Chromohalobacter sp. 296-RDG]